MSKSHHLTEQFWIPRKFIGAISLNLQGKVTKQAITFDRYHKQQPVNAAAHQSVTQKFKGLTSQVKKHICFLNGSEARQDPANSESRCDSTLAAWSKRGTLSLNTGYLSK